VDPTPTVARPGTVRADPDYLPLTDRDHTLRVHLVSDSPSAVRYRVAVAAPHLSIAHERGQFVGDTVIELAVDGSHASGQKTPGSVRIITTLGDVMVAAPLQMGLTAAYRGTLTYDDRDVSRTTLGTTRVALDLVERNGDLSVRIDPTRSLLFPGSAAGEPVVGRGAFTVTDGVAFSVKQVLPAGFAGKDDPFQRAIGRALRFHLAVGERGSLDGTFEEAIHGLFREPALLAGHAHFEREACAGSGCEPRVEPPRDEPAMPTADASASPEVGSVFPGWSLAGCTFAAMQGLAPGASSVEAAAFFDSSYHQPFLDGLAGTSLLSSSDPLGDLAAVCSAELALDSPRRALRCAQVAPLACALSRIADGNLGAAAHDTFARLYAHTIDVPLFVAHDDLVKAMKASFNGTRTESELLASARARLAPAARWVLQPGLLEYLRGIEPPEGATAVDPPSIVAARTLSRLFRALSTIDGETVRLGGRDRLRGPDARREAAQKKGLLALLEAATLAGVVESWKAIPPDLGAEFVDVLTPMDAGFSALLQGALVFGVPEGVIPNVYEPGRKPTNFEQLLDMAHSRVLAAALDEQAFTTAGRQFESDEDHLELELGQVSNAYDTQIKEACGDSFDLDVLDWPTCGSGDLGSIGARALAIQQAMARLKSAENRMQDTSSHIRIETDRVSRVKGVREGTIAFTQRTGEQLQALEWAEGLIRAEQKFLDVAANADVWNGGAPLGEAIGAFALEIVRTGIEADRQAVQTAQDVRVQEDGAAVEVINGMAVIKGLMVDLAQQNVESREAVVAVLQTRVDAENALASAKHAAIERARALSRIGKSPLRDPTFRLLRNRAAEDALRSRADAQRSLFRAGRGLEYHLNQSIGEPLAQAVLNAFDAAEAGRLESCLQTIFDDSQALPKVEAYTTEASVRRLLGIAGPRRDDVTGELLTEGEQFRRILLRNQNLDGAGGVGVELSLTLDPGNLLWSSNVCDDRLTQVEAQLVGDFLGDNQAEVQLDLEGGGVIRQCNGQGLMSWSTVGHAVVQAGVNTFGTAPPNGSLQGLAVASSRWRVLIPGPAAAPTNADMDLLKLEDVVLRIHHKARPIVANLGVASFACLGTIGAGR
jgi:hypothetical protein